MNSETANYILRDIYIVSTILFMTSLLLELVYPGSVASLIDIHLFLILSLLSGGVFVLRCYGTVLVTRARVLYSGVFALFNLFLVKRLLALQFGNDLLGLVVVFVLILVLFFAIIYSAYDRRRSD